MLPCDGLTGGVFPAPPGLGPSPILPDPPPPDPPDPPAVGPPTAPPPPPPVDVIVENIEGLPAPPAPSLGPAPAVPPAPTVIGKEVPAVIVNEPLPGKDVL